MKNNNSRSSLHLIRTNQDPLDGYIWPNLKTSFLNLRAMHGKGPWNEMNPFRHLLVSPLTSTVSVLEREVQSHNHRLYSKCWLAVNHPSKLDSFSDVFRQQNISLYRDSSADEEKTSCWLVDEKIGEKNILLQSYAYACTENFKRGELISILVGYGLER